MRPLSAGGPEVGSRVGPYVVEAVLGQGAMGIVYRAVHEDDGFVVALKVLRTELATDDVYRLRFAREARAASEVEHPHLVPIFGTGDVEGRPYLAVHYVAGCSLGERIEVAGQLSLEELLGIAAQVGAGLDALHEQTSSPRTSCWMRAGRRSSATSASRKDGRTQS